MLQLISNGRPFSTIELNTGVSLSYVEQGDKTGDATILLHGYGDSWYSFSRVLPLLTHEYHVFALDQRGHGNSSKAAYPYAMNDFAADVIAFMNAKGIDKATLVGHSMGSMVAQLVAIQQPERVSHLVLIGALVHGDSEVLLELNSAVHALVDPLDRAFVQDFQESTLYGSVPPQFLKRVIAESLKMPAHIWHEVIANMVQLDTTRQLYKIKAPTLLLWGDQDLIAPWDDQEILGQYIADTWLQIYERTGHALHWEQPERLVEDLELFWQQTKQESVLQQEQPILVGGGYYVH